MKSSVPYAVAAILAGAALRAFAAQPAAEPPPAPDAGATTSAGTAAGANGAANAAAPAAADQLATIVVTAQRRAENIQDVPISMQALTSQTMRQLNIQTFDDYVKYLPNVTAANNGPGQNEIFMRGVSAGSQASQGSGSTGLWPNVAVYLDDQSVQLPNRNLDIYAADLQRIEVLEGPQGTLFGAGAQAGVVRYITNKPKLDVTERKRRGRIRHDRPRRQQHGPDGGAQPAGDRRPHGGAGGDLQCPPRRLHRQRAGHVRAQQHRHRHSLRRLPGGERTVPGRTAEQWLLRAAGQPDGQQLPDRRQGHQPGDLPGSARRGALQVQ